MQAWLPAGLLLIVGGVFDLFDGALARATGKASKLGAFMDSVFDRAGEGVVYVGIVAGCVGGRLRRWRDPRRGRDGRGIHGQLRPSQVGEPRVHAGLGDGRGRARSA